MADHHPAELVVDALNMAVALGRLEPGCVIHSDSGSEYTPGQLRDRIRQLGHRQSMGRTESSFDNAAAESFHAVQRGEDHGETSPRADDRPGHEQLLASARTLGDLSQAGVECTGSYGAALSRYLHGEGITVFEVNQPDRATPKPSVGASAETETSRPISALYPMVLARLRWDTCPRGHIDRRDSEGKTYREALRASNAMSHATSLAHRLHHRPRPGRSTSLGASILPPVRALPRSLAQVDLDSVSSCTACRRRRGRA